MRGCSLEQRKKTWHKTGTQQWTWQASVIVKLAVPKKSIKTGQRWILYYKLQSQNRKNEKHIWESSINKCMWWRIPSSSTWNSFRSTLWTRIQWTPGLRPETVTVTEVTPAKANTRKFNHSRSKGKEQKRIWLQNLKRSKKNYILLLPGWRR